MIERGMGGGMGVHVRLEQRCVQRVTPTPHHRLVNCDSLAARLWKWTPLSNKRCQIADHQP